MITASNRDFRSGFACLVFLGLAMRAVMPAGYMPAPLAEGGPFVLCPGGLSGANYFLADDDGKHAHGHDHGAEGEDSAVAWEFCPTGFVSGQAALTADPAVAVPFLKPFAPEAGHVVATYPAVVPSYHARAPPGTQSRDA